ncbi:hypothetical protein [Nonlabens ulvanivorans]|uniref:Uncharacterized protein n=2 Tax=Nonlabens ulvanivorans TaxID=906888 RepID=A0A084JX49_NONUL|nr:hypothetical protein [Nonlabens ulvanivorans]KEZ93533.1 hypothetical protein IL45_04800 [Nonlabens ulvanivorans]PRX14109.1 hypothetical protein LY02_01138 [Nonlabens ulvanivorans]WOI23329.1 hypothetical protein R1T42_02530 [Nonlabens ulvanivorans]
MESFLDHLSTVYKTLLILAFLFYTIAISMGKNDFKPIFLYLMAGAFTEVMSKMITWDYFLVLGEKTNAPFFFLFTILQFVFLSYFFKKVIDCPVFTKYFKSSVIIVLIIGIIPYIFNPSWILEFSVWLPLMTIPLLLFFSAYYFIELLKNKMGYPFINIGLFIMLGTTLIFFMTMQFYEGVPPDVKILLRTLHVLPLTILHTLFIYECLLYFKSQIHRLTI